MNEKEKYNDVLLKELEVEFWNIQSKFDKLGDFGFKVKAFSITLTSAIVIAGIANKVGGGVVLLALVGLLAFFLLDRYQAAWKKALGARSSEITKEMNNLKMQRSKHENRKIRKAAKSGPPQNVLHAIELQKKKLKKNLLGELILKANEAFYAAQVVMILAISGFLLCEGCKKEDHDPPPKLKIKNGFYATGDELEFHSDLGAASPNDPESGSSNEESESKGGAPCTKSAASDCPIGDSSKKITKQDPVDSTDND